MITKEQELLAALLGKMEELRVRYKLISFQKIKMMEAGEDTAILDRIQEGESFIYAEIKTFLKKRALLMGLPEDYLYDHAIL